MSDSTDDSLDQVERQLAGAERALSAVEELNEQQAGRVAERMDRLTSQLLEVSTPPSMAAAHEHEGTEPAGIAEFETLAEQMGPPDGEGK